MLFLSCILKEKHLHIISFDNPYPPNYGGAIDVFYKIKALHQLGVKIYLHCFHRERNQVSEELAAITTQVFLYPKKRNLRHLFSSKPFGVISRFDKKLIENINKIPAPILIEGLQSSMIIKYLDLKKQQVFLRLHNVESNFFAGMSRSETSFVKKILYTREAKKYRKYQEQISQFSHVFGLSHFECRFLEKQTNNWSYLPVFHGNKVNHTLSETGDFALYHGDLRLPDNKKAAEFAISVFKKIKTYKLIIASSAGKEFVENLITTAPNIEFVTLENQAHLEALFAKAHINMMVSFQQSGTKLKVINALHQSRFCLINKNMVDDERILNLCQIATTEEEFVNEIHRLRTKNYLDNDKRKKVLSQVYNDSDNANAIISTIWKT
jgi:hypothetical protein